MPVRLAEPVPAIREGVADGEGDDGGASAHGTCRILSIAGAIKAGLVPTSSCMHGTDCTTELSRRIAEGPLPGSCSMVVGATAAIAAPAELGSTVVSGRPVIRGTRIAFSGALRIIFSGR